MQAERVPLLGVALVVVVIAVAVSGAPVHGTCGHATMAECRAEAASAQAVREAEAAKAALDEVMCELDELDIKVSQAVNAVFAAKNAMDRAAAKARLRQLMEEHGISRRRSRVKPMHVPDPCLANPLAEACS